MKSTFNLVNKINIGSYFHFQIISHIDYCPSSKLKLSKEQLLFIPKVLHFIYFYFDTRCLLNIEYLMEFDVIKKFEENLITIKDENNFRFCSNIHF